MSAFIQHVGYVDSLSVSISLSLTYTLLTLGLRMCIRRRNWGLDDYFVVLSTLVTLCHFGTSYYCLSHGLGRPYDVEGPDSLRSIDNATVVGVITFLVSVYLSKISTLVFMSRIASVMRTRPLYHACIVASVVLCIVSILLATVDCLTISGYYWNISDNRKSCPTQATRWQAITILDIISEAVLLILPINLVWSLQMARGTKMLVIGTFWTRAPVILLSILRQSYVQQLSRPLTDKSLISTLVVVLTEVQATYALASCTIASARNFVDNFNTGFGVGHIRGAAEEYNMSYLGSSGDRTRDIPMGVLSSICSQKPTDLAHRHGKRVSLHTVLKDGSSKSFSMALRPGKEYHHNAYIEYGRRRPSETGSTGGDSDELHILRQTEYTVSHDEAPPLPRS